MTQPERGCRSSFSTLRRLAPGGLALVFILAACGREPASQPDNKTRNTARQQANNATPTEVLTTFGAPDSWTREILRGVSTPASVLTGIAEPHDAELLPSQVLLLSRGRALVMLGAEIDGWLAAPFKKNGQPDARLIKALPEDFWKSHPATAGSDPQEAHVWLDPDVARAASAEMAKQLETLMPAKAEAIRRNAAKYDDQLRQLDEELKSTLAGLRDRRILVVHPGLEPFAAHFNLQISATYLRQVGREPSPQDVEAFTKAIKAQTNPVVLVSAGEMPGSLLKLAKDVPFTTVTFDPIELVSESEMDTYVSRLRQDVMNLATAVGLSETGTAQAATKQQGG